MRRPYGVPLGRLATDRQLDLERRRQDLLDQRWRRWRSMIVTMGALIGIAAGVIPVEEAMAALLRAIGAW